MLKLNNEKCNNCELCTFRKNVVNGRGSETAKILFVGEWPGSPEDDSGNLHSGPIWEGLYRLLSKAGIDPSEVYTTTVVRCVPKYRPKKALKPQIREPNKEEIASCSEYLDAEINHIKPTVIVPMGTLALRRVLNQGTGLISKYRGIELWSNKYNCKIMPIYHPLIVRRNVKFAGVTVADLIRIKKSSKYTTLTKKKLGTYKVADTIEKVNKLLEKLRTVDEFVFDIESSGLNGRKDQLLCISFAWQESSGYTIPLTSWKGREEEYTEKKIRKVRKKDKKTKQFVRVEKEVEVTKVRLIDEYFPYWKENQSKVLNKIRAILATDIPKIAHNGKFDCRFLAENQKMQVNGLKFDTMIAHYLLDENAKGRHGLKELAWEYTEMGGYDKPVEDWFKKHHIAEKKRNYAHLPEDMRNTYAAQDVDCTMRLKNIFEPMLRKDRLIKVFNKLLMPLSRTLKDIEINGMLIDKDYIEELKTEFSTELDRIERQFQQMVGTNQININSEEQLAKLLFEFLKLPVQKKTKKKGTPSTDESVLTELAKQHPIPKKILEYREVAKLYKTYVIGIEKLLDSDGYIHTEFLIHGTTTGRLSSKNPNLQNIPKDDPRIKNLFIAPPGWTLIEADYGQIEFRFWAVYSGDKQMIKDIEAATNKTGPDIHKMMASLALNIPVDKVTSIQRQQAKRIVFGLMYGRGVQSLAESLGCTEEHAKNVIQIFFKRYPKARLWLEGAVQEVRRHKEIRSFFGRIRRLPDIDSTDDNIKAMAERQAKNSPIQSAASDLNCNAANRLKIRFEKENMSAKIGILIHDALVLRVPNAELDKTLQVVREEMERPLKGINVPLVADFKIGTKWGDLHEVEVAKAA